jgi:hypothetical protein
MSSDQRYDFFLSRRGSVAAVAREVADVLTEKGYKLSRALPGLLLNPQDELSVIGLCARQQTRAVVQSTIRLSPVQCRAKHLRLWYGGHGASSMRWSAMA